MGLFWEKLIEKSDSEWQDTAAGDNLSPGGITFDLYRLFAGFTSSAIVNRGRKICREPPGV